MTTTERSKHECSDGGYVVGALRYMGSSPWQFQHASLSAVIGCSQLVCRECKSKVLQEPRVALAPGVSAHEVYAGDKLVRHLLVPGSPSSRLYCCSCFARTEIEATACRPPTDFDTFSSDLPWSCGGHPALSRWDKSDPATDQIAVATSMFTKEPSASTASLPPSDALKLMLAAADESLRLALYTMIRRQLEVGTGLALARALAVTEAEPGAFRDGLVAFDSNDRRLKEEDRTRSGWLLRDRLAAAIGAYVLVTQDWPSVASSACELLPGTASKALIRACISADPERIVDMLVARTVAARPHSSTLDHWAKMLERLIAEDSLESAGTRLERWITGASEQIAARVAVDRALDILLSRWQFRRPEAETLRILELIETYHPPRGFHRTIELLEYLFEHAASPEVESAALRALAGYYRTPPLDPEPGFEAYVRLLARCGDVAYLAERAWQSLLALDRLDLTTAAAEIVSDVARMKSLVELCLDARNRGQAESPLSQLFSRCLADDRGDGALKQSFRDSVAAHGWSLHDDHDPPVLYHSEYGQLALAADPGVRQVDWTREFQSGSSGENLLSDSTEEA